jgi:hypothetical protein
MSVLAYKILHIFGVLLAFVALGGLILKNVTGGDDRGRKLVAISHGLGLVVILVSGFGLLAKLNLGFEIWVWLKLAIWVLVGALLVLIRRMPQYATFFWFALPVLGGFAAYLALGKPW